MRSVWKAVVITVLALIVLGAGCAAVGVLTGASVERMIEVFFGDRESFELVLELLREEMTHLFGSF